MDIKVGVVCDRGLNPKRPVNQDSYLSVPEHGLFAVFDGVGGQQAGEVASRMAAETIEEALAHISNQTSHDLIKRAVAFANRDIYERAESDPAYKTMATTVALAHVEGKRATLAHVGDSRIYRLEDGYFYRETVDHTDYNDALRAGISLNVGGGGGNVINRALGVESEVEVEIKSISLSDGARLLLCSDGIYRHLADEEIATILAQKKDPQEAADELKRLVLARGADDNLTAIVVQLGRARVGRIIGIDDGLRSYQEIDRRATTAGATRKRPTEPRRAPASPAPNSRIEVAFKQEEASRSDEPWDWQAGKATTEPPNPGEARAAGSRTFIWILALLVCGVAGFYAGLRAPEWFGLKGNGAPDAPEATDTAGRIRAAREAFERGERLTAAADLERLINNEPQNPDARYWLGRIQLEQGEFARARDQFEEAIKMQVKATDAYLYAAVAHRALGERAKADALLERYIKESSPKAGIRSQNE